MIGDTKLHDAHKLLADLRDHLARHDKRVAFLFGAGTSCAVRIPPTEDDEDDEPLIPDVAVLTEMCKDTIKTEGDQYAKGWDNVWLACKEINQNPNVEDVLSRLRMMLEAIGASETLAGLSKDELTTFEALLRQKIASVANPPLDDYIGTLPHRQFARWLIKVVRQHPVEVFTVNYDILIELALEAERVPVFDGFVGSYRPFFHPDSLRHKEWAPGKNYTRLWKMHGSVTWQKETIDGRVRVVRGSPDQSGAMILPSFQKYDESRQQPYASFAERLSRFLETDDALLVICGFGFGDQHINNLIFAALENRPRTHAYALQYGDPGQDSDLAKRAHKLDNLVVVGPDSGIVGGRHAKWGAPNGLVDTLGMYEPIPNAQEVDTDNSVDLMTSVQMKVCDFAQFCRFLDSMTAN